MIRFAVQLDQLFHFFVLGEFPDRIGHTDGDGHDGHAAFNFEDVAVPEFAFGGVEFFVDFGADHVFNTDYAGVGFGGVIDEALAEV